MRKWEKRIFLIIILITCNLIFIIIMMKPLKETAYLQKSVLIYLCIPDSLHRHTHTHTYIHTYIYIYI